MIEKIIIDYLAEHKRLVVPQLGAFIVKQPDGKIIFSELLKRDDGVLRERLCAEGMTEIQAMGIVNRLVFDVRDAVGRGDRFEVKGLGAFYPAPNHTIRFVDAKQLRAAVARAAAEDAAENAANAADAANGGEAVDNGKAGDNGKAADNGKVGSGEKAGAEVSRPEVAVFAPDPADAEDKAAERISAKTMKEALKEGNPDPRTPKPRRADPAVKGLRYGDPMRRRGKSTVDKILLIAIIIALVAVGIIAYVYVSGRVMERGKAELLAPDTEMEYVEDQE